MANQNNNKGGQQQDVNQLLKVRREKLQNLQEAGKDPSVILVHYESMLGHTIEYIPPRVKIEISNFVLLSFLLTNIAFSCESSNKKSRKVMKLLKFKCNKSIFWCFHGYFS